MTQSTTPGADAATSIPTWQERLTGVVTAGMMMQMQATHRAMAAEIADLRAALAAGMPASPASQPQIKGHVLREVVNNLRDIAIKFHAAGQLRERLRGALDPLLSVENSPPGAREVAAWYVPHLLEFGGRRTSCPSDLVPQLDGTVAWGVELHSDGDTVTDKFGVEHKPRPLVFGDVTPTLPEAPEPVQQGGCSKCGCIGIHACPGHPLPAWTPEKIAEFYRVLSEYEAEP